jgi:LysM repeat protein
MKILKIFGIVVAVHAAAFMFVFAIPGCRSTTRRAPSPAETTSAGGEQKVYYPGLTGYSTTTPPDAGSSSPVSNADLNPGIVSAPADFNPSPVQPAESSGVRYNPTRPNTPTASALQSGPAADVQRVTTYTIVPRDSLWTVARKHGITVAELSAANNLKADAPLQVGKKLVIPAKAPAPTEQAGGIGGDTMTYTVKSGDNLGVIARRSGTTVGAIKTLNKLKGDNVTVGQKLVLPASADTAAALAATPATSTPRASGQDTEHVVQPNETLSQIARRYGVSQRAIGAANHISDPGRLSAGQRLIIPGVAKTNTQPAPAPTPPAAQPAPAPAPDTSPIAPSSPVSAPDSSPISAPADQPPVVPVEGGSPIAPAQS